MAEFSGCRSIHSKTTPWIGDLALKLASESSTWRIRRKRNSKALERGWWGSIIKLYYAREERSIFRHNAQHGPWPAFDFPRQTVRRQLWRTVQPQLDLRQRTLRPSPPILFLRRWINCVVWLYKRAWIPRLRSYKLDLSGFCFILGVWTYFQFSTTPVLKYPQIKIYCLPISSNMVTDTLINQNLKAVLLGWYKVRTRFSPYTADVSLHAEVKNCRHYPLTMS